MVNVNIIVDIIKQRNAAEEDLREIEMEIHLGEVELRDAELRDAEWSVDTTQSRLFVEKAATSTIAIFIWVEHCPNPILYLSYAVYKSWLVTVSNYK